MKRGAKRRFTGLWVYVMIYQCDFFFDKAKRQRFILQNEALALVELKRKKNRPVALRGHVTNASFKRLVGILLMPKIDRAHKNYHTPEI